MKYALENCCLRLSANVAYKNAAKNMEYITGIAVPYTSGGFNR
jgi:hypothetical protein